MSTNRISLLFAGLTLLALCGPAHATTTYFITGSVQQFIVPVSGYYDITGAGGQGGSGRYFGTPVGGGNGALIQASFLLDAGTVLDIYVGQQGFDGTDPDIAGGGGGGATWVIVHQAVSPLLVAGGGGGGGHRGGGSSAGTDVAGGTGLSGAGPGGGNGGGFLSSTNPSNTTYGAGFPTLTGGSAVLSGGNGGYGGGGGGDYRGGGGGGYTGGNGGACGSCGGGGGSSFLLSGTIPITASATQTGNGFFTISLVQAVPEPGTWMLAGLGLAAVVFKRKISTTISRS